MSILLFAFTVAHCCYCADSFVDTLPLVGLRSVVVLGLERVKMSQRKIKNRFVDVMVICGVLFWPVGSALGRYKDAIVKAVSCLEGN